MIDAAVRLCRDDFAGSTVDVARALLGCVLQTALPGGRTAGRIVETEAYLGPEDLASHAARLRSGRQAMARKPGVAYVYRSYGVHAMLNVVCEPEGQYGAVLIRALEPLAGLDVMAARRNTRDERLLCAGPGRLAQAMGIRLDHDRVDLVTSAFIWLERGDTPLQIAASGRIGISMNRDALLRFFAVDGRYVSGSRRGVDISGRIEPESGLAALAAE